MASDGPEFTRSEAATILLASYSAFLLSAIGALLAALDKQIFYCILFLGSLTSMWAVKHTYSRKLCVMCKVYSCPFNKEKTEALLTKKSLDHSVMYRTPTDLPSTRTRSGLSETT